MMKANMQNISNIHNAEENKVNVIKQNGNIMYEMEIKKIYDDTFKYHNPSSNGLYNAHIWYMHM